MLLIHCCPRRLCDKRSIPAYQSGGGYTPYLKVGTNDIEWDIEYRKIINLNTDSISDVLELYIDELFLEDSMELWINGRLMGIRLWSPYAWRVEKSWVKPGENEVKLRLTTLAKTFTSRSGDVHVYWAYFYL